MEEEKQGIPPTDESQQKEPPLGTPSTDEPVSIHETSTDTEPNPSTLKPRPSISENMEVHHHTHPGHHKKKLTDYFWEFLMLFLAVFCGFLAEYQLEHKIEKDRELQFIQSLKIDLQDDISGLDTMIAFEHKGVAQLDTLIKLLNSPERAKQSGDLLYYVARVGPRSNPFANNSRTFDQLKYSGGFRLIRNAESSDKIMGYYNQLSPIRLLEGNVNLEFDNYKRIGAKILDPEILLRQEDTKGEIHLSNDNPALLTYDGKLLKELAFHTLQLNGSRRSKIGMLENLKTTAVNLKSYLQKEYPGE